ncbi:MAG: sulfotransferase family 2 domain-containing protein [Pseudomonadota bacterium]
MWSQKAGCTTVVNWFFFQVGLLDEARAHSRWIHNYENEVFKKQDRYQRRLQEAMASGDYTVVKVVRDPFRRAASSFLVFADRPSARADHWTQPYWSAAEPWLAERGRKASDGISFMEHLDFLTEELAKGFDRVNLHLSPQHLPGEEAYSPSIVRIEDFASWVREREVDLSLKDSTGARIFGSAHHHKVTASRTQQLGERPENYRLKRSEFTDHSFPDSKILVNERSIGALRAAYARDVTAYGALYDL